MAKVWSLSYCALWVLWGCGPSPSDVASEKFRAECDSLRQLAEADFALGIRDYTRDGMIEISDFEAFYSDYMKRRYGVRMMTSCVIDEHQMCYAWHLNYKLEEVYGDSFTQVAYRKAEEMWKEQNLKE